MSAETSTTRSSRYNWHRCLEGCGEVSSTTGLVEARRPEQVYMQCCRRSRVFLLQSRDDTSAATPAAHFIRRQAHRHGIATAAVLTQPLSKSAGAIMETEKRRQRFYVEQRRRGVFCHEA